MRYSLEATGKRSFTSIVVEHNEEIIYFKGVQKVNGGNADQELFKFLNEYFSSLSEDKLNRHWKLLKDGKRILEPGYFNETENAHIKNLRRNNSNYEFLIDNLEPVIKAIYANIKPFDICYAAEINGYLNPPHDLNHMTRQGEYPAETTIDGAKYKELVKLAFTGQLVFPILSQLLDHVTLVTGKDYKDKVVGDLVSRIDEIVKTEGYYVLDTYLRASFLRQESRRNSIGIGSEIKFIDHIVYKGLFNKLCLTFLPSLIKGKNISNELNSLVEGEIRGNGDVKFKSFGDPKPNGDDLSLPESYLISQDINSSDIEAQASYFNFTLWREVVAYTEDGTPYPVKEDLTINPGFFELQCTGFEIKNNLLAEKIYNTIPKNFNFILTDVHIKLLQLAFQYKINYSIYPALDYEQMMAALSLAQVKLFELGFENLACIMFARRDNTLPRQYLDENYRLNTKDRQLLVELCSDYVGQQTASTDNSAVIAVTEFLDELGASCWITNIEPGLLGNQKYVDLMSANHTYPLDITSDIKKELLELIVIRSTEEEGL